MNSNPPKVYDKNERFFASLIEHSRVTFSGVGENVGVGIFTISGELILDKRIAGESMLIWDGKNGKGEDIARGIYI